MSLTPAQARAVHAPGSVTVLAGAGTGKTHMLTSRYLHHLAQGCSPLEVVAVTFTERAAAELRARVRAAVVQKGDPDVAAELEAAQISTIHALAARVCREHPEAAGVPPDFGVLSDLERPIWLAANLATAVDALPHALAEVLPHSRLLRSLALLVAEPTLADAAFECGSGGWPKLIARVRQRAITRLTEHPQYREATASLLAHRGEAEDPIEASRLVALSGMRELEGGDPAAALVQFSRISRRGGAQKRWQKGGLDVVKGALAEIQALVKTVARDGLVALELNETDDTLAQLLPDLKAAYETVRAQMSEAKRAQRLLDFADLEVHALRALECEEVRAYYRDRWRALLVDEFQDTSPAQAALLERVSGGATMTIVGDEKQAIYGFRGADAEVFDQVRRRLSERGGASVELGESFRTHGPLVDACNAIFAPVLGNAFQPLEAVRGVAPHEGPHVTMVTIDAPPHILRPARSVHEAHLIGQALKTLIDGETPVFDTALGENRHVRWGDVAVLTRTWAPLDTYSDVLAGLGVPALHTGGGNLLETREALDGVALIRFLADTRDNLALASVLRSPFFALDDLTLYTYAQSLPERTSWFDRLADSENESLASAASVLGKLVASRREDAPVRLLQRADYETGYRAVIGNLPGARRRLADWQGFLALVRQLGGALADVFTVARRLRNLTRAEVDVARPTLDAQDAVTLMTVHRAKGLEWPVVVLADLDRQSPNRTQELLFDRNLGVALTFEDEEGNALEPALYTVLKARAREREREEAKRVLYVALTRARDRVLLSATQATRGNLDVLAPGLAAAGVAAARVPFDPAKALYPDLPTPLPMPDSGAAATLWPLEPQALGPYARYVEPKDGLAVPLASSWDDVLSLAGDLDELWLEPLEALQQAGVDAPDLDTLGRELTLGGTVTSRTAICMWQRGDCLFALAEAHTPAEAFDQVVFDVDPALPETVAAAAALLQERT